MASATSYSTGYATAASSSSMSATYAGSSSSLSTCVAEAPQANITKIVKARVIRYVIEYPESHQLVRKHRSDLMNMDIYDPPVHSRVEISVPARDLVIVSINLATFQFYTDCAPCFAENISTDWRSSSHKNCLTPLDNLTALLEIIIGQLRTFLFQWGSPGSYYCRRKTICLSH